MANDVTCSSTSLSNVIVIISPVVILRLFDEVLNPVKVKVKIYVVSGFTKNETIPASSVFLVSIVTPLFAKEAVTPERGF